jgi:hypothetical protein
LYIAAKYPRRLETEMDQSTIDPIASTTPSMVVTVGIGGSGGDVVATPKVWPDRLPLAHNSSHCMLVAAPFS